MGNREPHGDAEETDLVNNSGSLPAATIGTTDELQQWRLCRIPQFKGRDYQLQSDN